ncbi:transglycosylase domain-containing protein [Nonomuraea jiangxiensis]|uniref:Membrane carboxypeptidase (Penicillin-binding protein) n=1 Tax=Nonomuraea jiangxiensis TaxID=633440 RepID=A0A1G8YI39_9ACTN|nr:transglycosylase domain-containing protein [Nonomuraea jiangxiensis]SDK02502.1 Membrane carboxypeptidase (penicillin-binding protein) [Nonomuraea jiangxiensis]
MAAQPYDDQGGGGDRPPPRPHARQDTRALSAPETMISDGPRRSRRRGQGGGPPEPPGPPRSPDDKGRGGWRRFVPGWKIVVAGFVVLAAGMFGMVMVAYANTPVPTATQSEALAQASTLYYRDKSPITKLGMKRELLDNISQISDSVKDGAIAIENDTFYEDSGISISGIFRSAWMTLSGQQLQGASTITQQMARAYYDGLSQEVSVKRKVMEIFVAVKLDDTMSKDDILLTYFNTINFGRAYGIEAAAKAYFGPKVTAAKLTPEQGAYLAARIQQPNWEPDAPGLKSRFNDVVNAMARVFPEKYGNLPKTAKFPKTVPPSKNEEYGGLKGYMVTEVLRELKDRGLTEDEIRTGGYDIYTTFDKKLMKAAATAMTSTMAKMDKEFHGGLAAVDPKTGRVLATFGGTNYLNDPWNEPFDSKKQAASAFKPYVLAAWLQSGYSLKSFVPGNETVPKKLPGQADGGFKNSHNVGPAVDVIKATADSVNTAYVSMAYALPGKIDDVKNLVEAAGFNQERMEKDVEEHHYQFAIGSAPVTPVEQAAGYSIFANAGEYRKYHVVREVKLDGKVAYPELNPVKRVITPEAAADSTVAMEAVLKSGTAAGQGLGNRPAAGKTGTNNDENGAWFVGYTPQISTAVGFYREECRTKSGKVVPPIHSNCPETPGGKPHPKYNQQNPYTRPFEVSLGFEGAGPPTEAWRKFMLLAHEGLPIEQFPTRADYGVAENIVPSPTPTPTVTPDDPFDNGDNPFDGGDGEQDCIIPPCGVDNGGDNGGGVDHESEFPTGSDDVDDQGLSGLGGMGGNGNDRNDRGGGNGPPDPGQGGPGGSRSGPGER